MTNPLPDAESDAFLRDSARGESLGILAGRLGAVRRRLVWQVCCEGGLKFLSLMVLSLGLLLGADYLLGLPRSIRAVAGLGLLTGLGMAARRWLLLPWRTVPAGDSLALWVERRLPPMGSRLISAVQLNRSGGGSPEGEVFVDRLLAASSGWGAGILPAGLAPWDSAIRWAWGLVPTTGLGLALFAAGWPTTGILLRRAFLEDVPLPQRTRIVEVEAPEVVGRGDDVRVDVRVEGVIPRVGSLRVRQDSGRLVEYTMDAEEVRPGWFGRTLGGVVASFVFRVRVHDAESPDIRVEVLPRPVLTNLVLTQELPAYTGLGLRTVVPGDLTVLRGSRLRIEATASQPLASVRVRLLGTERVVDLGLDGAGLKVDGGVLMDDAGIHGFSLELLDKRGIASRDAAVYAVNVVEDGPPQVRILVPARREELVTPRGTVLVAMEARDDFGLGGLRLRHQAALATQGEPALIELDLGGETNLVVRRRFEWRLPTLQPPLVEGALHEFWVEAEDRNDLKGRQVGRSDRYLLRVVTEAEKRADLLGRAGDAIGRLGEVAQGQERLNESLGRIILTRPGGP